MLILLVTQVLRRVRQSSEGKLERHAARKLPSGPYQCFDALTPLLPRTLDIKFVLLNSISFVICRSLVDLPKPPTVLLSAVGDVPKLTDLQTQKRDTTRALECPHICALYSITRIGFDAKTFGCHVWQNLPICRNNNK